MKDIKDAKKHYDQIEIPDNLEDKVEEVLCAKPHRKIPVFRIALTVAAACFAVFIIGLNTNQVFAESMGEIPFIKNVAKVLTFKDYEEENDVRYLSVEMPEIVDTGYDALEKRINSEIRLKINEIIKEADERAKEYRDAYLETGGKEEDAWKMEIQIDYDIKCRDEHYLSFVINKTESLASCYTEQYFYNIDLETGKELTLRDLLGPSYIEKVNKSVKKQIEQRIAEDENVMYFGYGEDEPMEKFETISTDQKFYVNEDQKVVIVFDKYDIAPGYMGIQTFIID